LKRSLKRCFEKVAKEKGLPPEEILSERRIVGNTLMDLLFGREVSVEVKFEPDYPDMPPTRKPGTNVVLEAPDPEVAKYAGLTSEEAQMRLYEVALDFLKLMAHKKKGVPYNYLLCLDEDGRLYRNLDRSFKTPHVKRLSIPWKSIRRGIQRADLNLQSPRYQHRSVRARKRNCAVFSCVFSIMSVFAMYQ
jgi:hypothetical protein